MDRWSVEESQHGELLNRVLQITGVEGEPDWQQRLKREIPFSYRLSSLAGALISNPFGSHFATAHMVWGTINELTTLQAYRRLWELAANPVLTRLLKAIAQEESVHVTFYWHIARLKLARSVLSRKFSRKIIECFWAPVGSGIRPADGLDHLVRTLFSSEGTQSFERGVHDRINRLPGFSSFEKVRNRLLSIVNDPTIESAGVL